MNANWSFPTPIRFGAGRISELAEVCKAAGATSPLLITDKGLAAAPITEAALAVMDAGGLGRAIFSDVDANPNETNMAAGIAAYKVGGHDAIVGFGGGSALDLAKMVALMANQRGDLTVWELEDIGDWWTRADGDAIPPVIAVPTTAGTGSEVGRAGVLTNSATHVKKIIFHPNLMPATVIADPELTVGMPAAITAGTGMDAFAHCLEAYSSPHYHPMSQGIALEGLQLVKDNLLRVYAEPGDIEARGHMMSAAAMGATAFQKGLGVIHALSHPIGAVHNTHHGATNALFMEASLAFNRPAIEPRIEAAAAYLGLSGGFDGFVGYVTELKAALGMPKTLGDLGVQNPDFDALAAVAITDPSCGGNPVELTEAALRDLYAAHA